MHAYINIYVPAPFQTSQPKAAHQSRDCRPPPSGGGSTIKYPVIIDEGQLAKLRWEMTAREVERQVTNMTKKLAQKVSRYRY